MLLPECSTATCSHDSDAGMENGDEQAQVSTVSTPEPSSKADSPGRQKLKSWLNKNLKIEMTDGRVLVGVFLCTDRDANVILGSCSEYLQPEEGGGIEEPRVLGLVMVPGRHIVSIHLDDITSQQHQLTPQHSPLPTEQQGAEPWPEIV